MEKKPGIFMRYLEQGILAKLGLVMVILILIVTFLGPLFAPYDPLEQDLMAVLQPPGEAHLLGTDELGRDILSRVVCGAANTLQIAVTSIFLAMICGLLIGLTAGYWKGLSDRFISALMDAMLSFPPLVLALAIAAAMGRGGGSITLAIAIVYTSSFGRLVRGLVLSVREMEFVLAAKAIGTKDIKIIYKHILPNILAPIIIQATLGMVVAILAEAGLSFLGLGSPPPTPSWGSMVKDGYNYLHLAPSMAISPGLAIFITVLGFNFFGDGIRDLMDPFQQKVFKQADK